MIVILKLNINYLYDSYFKLYTLYLTKIAVLTLGC